MPFKPDKREYRTMPLLSVAEEKRLDSNFYVEGYATTFDDTYELGEFDGIKYFERIDRNALEGADMTDIIMQFDHGGRVYARNQMGDDKPTTLIVEANDHGIFIAADLTDYDEKLQPIPSVLYRDIYCGKITKMSWAFTIADEEYDRSTRTRIIKRIRKIYDVSAVSMPANSGTEISARSFVDGVINKEKQELLERENQQKAVELQRQKLMIKLKIGGRN